MTYVPHIGSKCVTYMLTPTHPHTHLHVLTHMKKHSRTCMGPRQVEPRKQVSLKDLVEG